MAGGFLDLTITFEGQADLVGRFATWGYAIQNLSPALEQVGELLQQDWRQQFADEGGYLGAKVGPSWALLRPATVADRERRGFGGEHPMLVRYGDLRASVIERGALGNVFEVSPTSVRVGTEYPTAGYHQHGTSRMVARKMIGLKWESRSRILRILGNYVREQARLAGLDARGAGYRLNRDSDFAE